MPGRIASSSASTPLMPVVRSTEVTYEEISCQCRLISFWMFSSRIESWSVMGNGSEVCEWKRSVPRSNESARLCAGSMLITSVR